MAEYTNRQDPHYYSIRLLLLTSFSTKTIRPDMVIKQLLITF
jgi:hypothetical protein